MCGISAVNITEFMVGEKVLEDGVWVKDWGGWVNVGREKGQGIMLMGVGERLGWVVMEREAGMGDYVMLM